MRWRSSWRPTRRPGPRRSRTRDFRRTERHRGGCTPRPSAHKWTCRTGVCHICECMLIDGDVTYGPDQFEPPASGNVLICCLLPVRDIEIDL
ncbi:MAG: 2Fe-2S iron-sulfur cluster-binding protein [Betaproteobacteria bacterium]